ncbi:ankyrin repeat and SOCS box protein 3 [Syngnathoides biaculeatus]|uniref:ankyrin repeat and SOCS box protein 3 n=1 Tax=Syngnathoides biaculeatus TaxID=300417 RepID=UPI002ADD3CEA|nr:ankyrin repeat and SOCS box protein 3 [Syngnathoides biaculeatus]
MDFSECYEDSVSLVAAAARSGSRRRLRLLIRQGRSVHRADNRGWRALHEAAAAGDVGCLKEILSAVAMTGVSSAAFKAYVNSSTHEGESACYLAAERGHLDAVLLLLKARANADQLTNDLSCPLYAAVSNGHGDVVRLLLAKGAKVNGSHTASCWTCLHQAVYRDHVDIVSILVLKSANLEARDDYNITPLFLAAQYGRRECLEVLVHAGANVNTQASDLASPLLLASQEGHLACVDFLLENGADPNMACSRDWRQLPIHAAAQFGHLGVLRRLIGVTDRKCDRGECSKSPLCVAVHGGQAASVKLLLDQGFSPDGQDCDCDCDFWMDSPLSLALKQRFSEAAGMLLAAGAGLRMSEWGMVLAQDNADMLKLVLDHRWLRPSSEEAGGRRKTALETEELEEMWTVAEGRLKSAGTWLPLLLKAGLEPRLALGRGILEEADSDVLNFFLQFRNWSTMDPVSRDLLCRRRAEGTWRPLPQFDSIPDLSHLCRLRVRTVIGPDVVKRRDVVRGLPVPELLRDFLRFDDVQMPAV